MVAVTHRFPPAGVLSLKLAAETASAMDFVYVVILILSVANGGEPLFISLLLLSILFPARSCSI
jgi:hypothetical protein